MCNENFVNTILLDWAAKSPNGLLSDVSNEENIQSLYESMLENGINQEDSISVVNDVSMLAEKGKHPERQAYNKNGLLVTFPTPEYKANAIKRGTHFEKDPKVAQSNLFGGGKTAPSAAAPATPTTPDASPMDTKQSELPPSATTQAQTPPAQKEVPEPGTPGTPAASPTSSPVSSAPTQPPAQGELPTAPVPTTPAPANVATPPPTPTPPPVQKTPAELAAEKEVIKQILNTNDTMPTIPGVGGVGISEELKTLTKVALEMNLNEAVKFLSKYL